MPIAFFCTCGKALRARDEAAGKKTRCPDCQAIISIPSLERDPYGNLYDEPYGLAEPPKPASSPYGLDEALKPPSTFHPIARAEKRPEPIASTSPSNPSTGGGGESSSLLEYAYLLLAFALIPLVISLLTSRKEADLQARFVQSMAKASPEEKQKMDNLLNRKDVSIDEAIAALPGGKLDGAHLARDTSVHWIYAAIAAAGFLLLLGLIFSVERASPLHLLGIGAFTGTVGIIFLLGVQFCSNIRVGRFGGRGIVAIIVLILTFIGWSYNSANDPDSNFLLSAFGFTFGVGLCEEFTKAIPMFFYFKRDSRMGWRGACLWGLASGIGFGVSEGIMYSGRYYNGLSGIDIYLVRFISCVALHAMWSGSVGIAIARNVEDYEGVEDGAGFGLFMLRVLAVPMTLHGFYDTLLKKDMNVWALVVALLSFAWFAWHVEMTRGWHRGAGRPRATGRNMAY